MKKKINTLRVIATIVFALSFIWGIVGQKGFAVVVNMLATFVPYLVSMLVLNMLSEIDERTQHLAVTKTDTVVDYANKTTEELEAIAREYDEKGVGTPEPLTDELGHRYTVDNKNDTK